MVIDMQIATSLLTSCNKLFNINKLISGCVCMACASIGGPNLSVVLS